MAYLPALRIAAVCATLLAGCAVGPDFETPKLPDNAGYGTAAQENKTAAPEGKAGGAQHLDQGADIQADWWALFHSEPLNRLIEQALAQNADLAAGQAALRAAYESVYAQEGSYYPQLSANFTPLRQKDAAVLSPTLATPTPIFNLFTTQLTVSYTPDVWGANRRAVESEEAQAESQRFQLIATYLTLTSNLVGAAVQEASLRAQIAATREIVDAEQQLLDLTQRQFTAGQISQGAVIAQRAALAQAQATLPPLVKQLDIQRDLLTALAGRLPSQEIEQTFELDKLVLPLEIPLSLPSKLVAQRPDLRQAEANLHAASANIGIAIANRLPNITLSANAGSTATEIGQLFHPGSSFWEIAGGITAPIFDGNTLLHKERGARALYDQAAAQYRSTVITAFQNVADALKALSADADALQASVVAERAAAESLDIVRQQLKLGAINYLDLLNAETTYQQARITLVQAQATRYADTAALFQALGGGWWNRGDAILTNADAE
jgi:NodT family efflux transporter outer membrane factor (OMF) lipoprotein